MCFISIFIGLDVTNNFWDYENYTSNFKASKIQNDSDGLFAVVDARNKMHPINNKFHFKRFLTFIKICFKIKSKWTYSGISAQSVHKEYKRYQDSDIYLEFYTLLL